jgi:RNA polymerase sigma-70 factor, ECF subfamily
LKRLAETSNEGLDAQRVRVVRLCRLLLGDREEAQDVAQEVLLKLFLAQQSGRVASAGWINKVAVNACRDRRRSAWWRRWYGRSLEFREENHAVRSATPEDAVIALETRHRVWAAFRRLSRRQQEVFALRHVEGLSTAEAADVLDLSPGSAKRHLFRAVHRMRVALRGPS